MFCASQHASPNFIVYVYTFVHVSRRKPRICRVVNESLRGMRTDEAFAHFFSLIRQSCKDTNTSDPVLPHERRAPCQYEVGTGEVFTAQQFRNITAINILKH